MWAFWTSSTNVMNGCMWEWVQLDNGLTPFLSQNVNRVENLTTHKYEWVFVCSLIHSYQFLSIWGNSSGELPQKSKTQKHFPSNYKEQPVNVYFSPPEQERQLFLLALVNKDVSGKWFSMDKGQRYILGGQGSPRPTVCGPGGALM